MFMYATALYFCNWPPTTMQHKIHAFIPLACTECNDSLPFSGASTIPLCYVPCPSTLSHQLVFHPPSLYLAIYFLVYLSALLLLLKIKALSTHHILSYDNVMKTVGVELLDTHHAPSLTAFHVLLWVMIWHTMWQNVAWSQWPVQNSISVVADKLQHRSLAEFSVKDVTAFLLEHQYKWGWVTACMIIE
jgi:hypothetical protein